ncbi:MAG: hypothetical protein AVDCRST_MAG09-2321, partial [uncultured Sphingomonas sp.]
GWGGNCFDQLTANAIARRPLRSATSAGQRWSSKRKRQPDRPSPPPSRL